MEEVDVVDENDEVAESRFVSQVELNKMLEKEKFVPFALKVYEEYRKEGR